MFTQLKELWLLKPRVKKGLLLFVWKNCVYAYMLLLSIPKTLELGGDFKLLDIDSCWVMI